MTKRLPARVLLATATLTASILVPMQSARAATTASIVAPSALTASDTITFPSNVWHVNISNVVLRVQGTTTNLGALLACYNGSHASVGRNLGSFRTDILMLLATLTTGQRHCRHVNTTV